MEKTFVETKVLEVSERIRLTQDQLDIAAYACQAGTSSLGAIDTASEKLKEARASVDEIRRHIEATAEVAPLMRDCTRCGKSIRAGATMCGFCWAKS